MNEQEQPAEMPAPTAPDCLDKSADLADQIYNRLTRTGAAALTGRSEIIQRRTRTFRMCGQNCAPDVFVDGEGNYIDFELTLRSLNSKEEIEALSGISDAGEAPFRLAKAGLYAINGKPIPRDRIDWFWEAFGMGGRQVVMLAFRHMGNASEAALGKFQATFTVG